MTRHLLLTLLTSLCAASANATLVFTLADTDDLSLSHTSSDSGSPPNSGSQSVGNGTFSWGSLSSDGSANTAEFSGGSFTSSDWGGEGTFTSTPIDVSSALTATIDAQFDGEFNTGSEFSNFFYSLDGGTPVEFGVGAEDVEYSDEIVSIEDLDVTGASSLTVGFTYDHNGGSDFFNVDSFTVNVQAIPEPTAALFGSLVAGALGVTLARRPADRDEADEV